MNIDKNKEIIKYIEESKDQFQAEKKALKLEMIAILNRQE